MLMMCYKRSISFIRELIFLQSNTKDSARTGKKFKKSAVEGFEHNSYR